MPGRFKGKDRGSAIERGAVGAKEALVVTIGREEADGTRESRDVDG
jgi:hypothetical protein